MSVFGRMLYLDCISTSRPAVKFSLWFVMVSTNYTGQLSGSPSHTFWK
jgi:hypothetical protein